MRARLTFLTLFAILSSSPACGHHFDGGGEPVDLLFLGDTSFGESYQERRAEEGEENVLVNRGYDYLIENFARILQDVNFVIANLETPITNIAVSPFAGRKDYIHYADVEKTPSTLRRHGFDLVSLANNHSLDFGLRGLAQTLDLLQANGIESCGAGLDEPQARTPYVHEIGVGDETLYLAVFCAFELRETYQDEYAYYANGEVGGVNPLAIEKITADVQLLRRAHPNAFTVAFLHWGNNYRLATEEQRMLGRALVDAGIDLVIGQGAHLLQELEYYRGHWIVYGLGNFVFASPGRYERYKAHPYGMIARLRLEPRDGAVHKAIRLYPIMTDNTMTNYHTRFVSEDEFAEVKTILATQSFIKAGFNTVVHSASDQYGWYLEFDLDSIDVAGRVPKGELIRQSVSDEPRLHYFLYVPRHGGVGARVFVTVHGVSRNAEEHARLFAPLAESYGVVLVAPVFSEADFPSYQRLGRKDDEERADVALDHIIDEVRNLIGAETRKLYLFGHSGGGQFVHRYAMLHPDHVARYVVSAAGWYTFPDASLAYPLGIGSNDQYPGLAFDAAEFLRVPACVMVGGRDVHREESLNTSRSINAQQGHTRLVRAELWVSAMSSAAQALGLDTTYTLDVVPRADHLFVHVMQTGGMGPLVFECLFGHSGKNAAGIRE